MKLDKTVSWQHGDPDHLNLNDLSVAVVGGTSGIARAISRFMAARGTRVLVIGRTFRDADVPGTEFRRADLSLMHEAHRVIGRRIRHLSREGPGQPEAVNGQGQRA